MANARVQAIVDGEGRIIAAQLSEQAVKGGGADAPSSLSLRPAVGQRQIAFDVPSEVLALSGRDLEHLFSHVSVTWPADVQVADIQVVKAHDHK